MRPTTNFLHFHASMHKEAGNREWLQNNLLDCSFNKIPLEKTGCWPVSCSSTFDARVSLSPDSPTQMLRQSFWILSSLITFCFFSFFLLLSLSYNSIAILVNYIHLNEQHKNHGLSHTNIHNCQTLKYITSSYVTSIYGRLLLSDSYTDRGCLIKNCYV